MRFDALFTFIFSPRPGTPAAKAPDQVPQKIKAARAKRMATACDAERDRQLAALIGSTAEVLLETRNADGLLEGYTPTYVPVYCHTTAQPGDSITCRLTAFHDGACTGEQLA